MRGDEVETGVRDAWARLLALRAPIEAGSPWPLSPRFDDAPEATWGPPEVLAHLVEMVPYWQRELERVGAGSSDGTPVAFGRTVSDPNRIGQIGRLREESTATLYASLDSAIQGFLATWARWSPEVRARVGAHPIRGELTVEASVRRMIVGHLADHADQLEAILDTDAVR